jgi:hypothetical protein
MFSLVVLPVLPAFAQTQQPFLFANTVVNDSTAVVTFTRNDSTGALTAVAGRQLLHCVDHLCARKRGHEPDSTSYHG